MGAEISKYLEQDERDNDKLLETQLTSTADLTEGVRRSSADVATRSQIFAFCQHWDVIRVTEFLRWYTDLVKAFTTEADNVTRLNLLDITNAHGQVDRLINDMKDLENLVVQLEAEIESVKSELSQRTIPVVEVHKSDAETPRSDDLPAFVEEFEARKRNAKSQLRQKAVALHDLKLRLLGSIEGVELLEIVKWPLFVQAMTHVDYQETVWANNLFSTNWHPACIGFAMQREGQATAALEEYNKGDILLLPLTKREIDGYTDDSASSSVASEDESDVDDQDDSKQEKKQQKVAENSVKMESNKDDVHSVENDEEDSDVSEEEKESSSDHEEPVHPIGSGSVGNGKDEIRLLSEETLAEHTSHTAPLQSGSALADAMMRKPRVIKRSIPDLFDATTRSPLFFGYTYEKPKNRVQEILENEMKARAKEDEIFEMKIRARKEIFETTLAAERGKLQALAQKESSLQTKREKHWAKRMADLERARKELDPNDVFFVTFDIQDKTTRDREGVEDTEMLRQKQSIDTRMETAEQEYASYVDEVAAVRCTDHPLGNARLRFHSKELERYEHDINTAKNDLATAQEEYAALTTSKLRAPGQETKLRSQVLFAEDQLKTRETQLERVCCIHENEQFLFQQAQQSFDKEQRVAPLFKCLSRKNTLNTSTAFAFHLIDLAIALLLGIGRCALTDKIKFLFKMFARSHGQTRLGFSTAIQVIDPEPLVEVFHVVLSILSRLGDLHLPRAPTREFLQPFVEREFLKLNRVLPVNDDIEGANASFGMTFEEFHNCCIETIECSRYLCELFGHPWKYEQLSRFVLQHMSAIQQYKLGLINVNDLKYALARQVGQPREALTTWNKVIIHERALAMGKDDPLKTNYSKYLPKHRTKLLSNVVPLDHGGYRNLVHYRKEIMQRSAVRLQSTWRARKGRQAARFTAEKQAFYHARGLALEEARQSVENEWKDRDVQPAHSVDKMKLEAKIRMKQVKLRAKGNSFSRDQVLALMVEEAVQAAQKEVEYRFREMEEEQGYLKHDVALQLPHTEMDYLKPEVAKGLVAQLLNAKQESALVGSMLNDIARVEEATKRKRKGSKDLLREVPETDTSEEVETHFVDKEAIADRAFRTKERREHMMHGHFPFDLSSSGLTRDEISLQMTLAFPDPSLHKLQKRLKHVCDGMTDFKLAELLQELPSKRHICDYVTTFRRYDRSYDTDALARDLYDHFRIIRGSSQLATALVNITESDLEFGLTQNLLDLIQHENEKLLRQMVTLESHEVEANLHNCDPSSFLVQNERHMVEQQRKKALEAHAQLVSAMKAWKEAEMSLLETEKRHLRACSTYPILPAHRTRWSDRFQNALQLGEADSEQMQAKYTEILHVCQDFIDTASAIALVLVREFYLPLREKSILPCNNAQIDGRSDNIRRTTRWKYEAHDILFKVCTDDHGRFEASHEYAAKAGGHEVRNSAIYLRELSGSGHIRVPLQCTVDFQGFRVLCSSKLPMEVTTWTQSGDGQRVAAQLVHGSADRGKTISFQNQELDEAFARVAARLNLSRHSARGYKDVTSKSITTAADMRGYLNGHKHLVVVHFARAMPPEDPNVTLHLLPSTRGMSILWRQLRPELVKRFPVPLSPDALSLLTYRTPDWELQARGVRDATTYLVQEVIPLFAVKLSQRSNYFDSPEFDLVTELHRHGINVRHLGLLRSQFLFQLSGTATLQYSSPEVPTSQDFTREIKRGAHVHINGKTFTISSDQSHRFDASCVTLTASYMDDSLSNVAVYGGRLECRERAGKIRRFLLGEMVARTFKNIVRHFMRQTAKTNSTGLTSMLQKQLLIQALNLLSGSRRGSERLWQKHVFEGIRARFGLRAVSEVDKQNLRRNLLPLFAYIVRRVAKMLAAPLTSLCLERVAKMPDCYTFVLDDFEILGDHYRLKHNVSMLSFSMASLLLLQATIRQATSFKQVVVADKPSGYWPLNDRRGALEPKNFGLYGGKFRGKYLPGCTLEGDGPVRNAAMNRSVLFRKEARTCVVFPYDKRFYPDKVSSHVSLETWCRCDGHESTRRVVLTLGRFCLSALKGNVWAFSMNVKNIDVVAFGAKVEIGKWTHLVGTYDGAILRFYVDGLLQNEVEVDNVVDVETQKLENGIVKAREDIADLEDEAKGACFKESDQETRLFFETKEGRQQVKAISVKLHDEYEMRVRLARDALTSEARSIQAKNDTSKVAVKSFEPVAKKQICREKFDTKWLVAAAKFKEMRESVNLKIQRELDEHSKHETRQLCIGCLSRVGKKTGTYFFHGNIAHVAYYNGKMLSRDQINAHYVMGTRDRAHDSDHLFALASSRFARALEYAPDDKKMLEKFAENICASLKYDLDQQHAQETYKKKVQCGLKAFVATENAHSIAQVMKSVPREPIYSDLFMLCYHSVLTIQPTYFQATESEQCRLALPELGRMPFAFFLGSRSANSLVNISSWYDHSDDEEAIVSTFADIVCKVVVHFPTFYGDQATNFMWLRELQSPQAVIYFVLAMESSQDACLIDLKDVVDITEEDMDVITKNNVFCTRFQLAHCSHISDITMTRMAFCCSQLEELDISYCTLITDLGLGAIGKACHRLVRLKMARCSQIRDAGVEAIVRTNPRLSELSLSFCERITDRCFLAIGQSCPELSVLEMELCVQLSNSALKCLARTLVNPVKLRRLNFGGCRRIGDDGLLDIVKVCTGLQDLNIRQCDKMTDLSIRALTHACLELKNLNLEELGALSYKVFTFDQEGDGRGIADKNLLLKMKSLNLSGCVALNDLALGHLSHRAKAIESLSLSACTELTDQGILWLLDDMLDRSIGGTHLSHFDISYCPGLTASGIHKVVQRCPALVSLNLSGCTHLSDPNIIDIIASCTKLVQLELAFCRELTDNVLYAIAKHLSLEELNLSRCVRVTDEGMVQVAGQSAVLRRLNVSACKKLSERTLTALFEGCRLLEEMDVTHCSLFSAQALARFAKRKVQVICRKAEESLITSAVEAIEMKEYHERKQVEKQQLNAMSSEALRYMTSVRRDRYANTVPIAVKSSGKKPFSTNLLPIVSYKKGS